MKDYLDYIEESTNTVKSKTRLSKLLVVLSYLVIWAFNIMASWRFPREVLRKHRQVEPNGLCSRPPRSFCLF